MGNSSRSDFIKKKIQEKKRSAGASSENKVKISSLVDNPFQPRMEYDKDELRSLAASIQEKGLLQPIVVSERNGTFVIVAGHRRKRACEICGLDRVPALVLKDVGDKDLMLIAAAENLVRVDLSVIEEAKSYYDMTKNGISVKEIAATLGVLETSISRKKNLLGLSDEILEDIRVNNSTKDVTALTILRKIDDEKEQVRLYYEFLQRGREWLRNEVKNCACAITDASQADDITKQFKKISRNLIKKSIPSEKKKEIGVLLQQIDRILNDL